MKSFRTNYEIATFLEKYLGYEKLMHNGLMTKSSLVDRILCGRPPAGAENYSHFQKMWKQEIMQSIKHVLRRYNNKDFDPTLEAIEKMVEFHLNKGVDVLNCG